VKYRILTALACGTLLASVAVAPPASAHGGGDWEPRPPSAGEPVTRADGLTTPLSLEVDRHGVSYVTQNFIGKVSRIDRDGTVTDLASVEGQELAGVSTRRGTVYYTQVAMDHSSATLMALRGGADPVQVADIYEHESTENPDAGNTYGFLGLKADSECGKQFPADFNLSEYTGIIDTHPFSTLAVRRGVYVADAGANAILRVRYDGSVETVAVLPPREPITVTAELLKAQGLPECAAAYPFVAEPVPTDIEQGRDGWLYVTSLPGGPEDASLGARGSVVKVNPWSGEVRTVATGFVGATNLAVSQRTGNIYVTELFGGPEGKGQVSVLTRRSDTPTKLIDLAGPAAVELRNGKLYVTTNALVFGEAGQPLPESQLTVVRLKERNHWGYDSDAVTEDSFSGDDE
jgi:hypothetical protein